MTPFVDVHIRNSDVSTDRGQAHYFEHKGKDSGIVRFTFEMIEGLKIVEEEEAADSQEG